MFGRPFNSPFNYLIAGAFGVLSGVYIWKPVVERIRSENQELLRGAKKEDSGEKDGVSDELKEAAGFVVVGSETGGVVDVVSSTLTLKEKERERH